MLKLENYYDCEEIAIVLSKLASGDNTTNVETVKDLIEVLYNLEAIANNEYNADYYRTFWNVLQNITNYNI